MLTRSGTLASGDPAPAFSLPTTRGDVQSLDVYLARGPVLLVFHRGTWCPSCRKRFEQLAALAPEIVARGVSIVAVVAQKASAVRRYVEDAGLPFYVLIDEQRDVARQYGVWHRRGLDAWNIARPACFAIDRTGIVRTVFVGESQAEFPTQAEIGDAVTGLTAPA